ncbi:hypothetical protein TERMP_00224 [Thermococcus barophilus MP]|uniref:Uncharacterized protein n=2 Tax=Thermococcus barophilus TaxID=55802 RepID=F0LI47_THEBM|nr:hypothetical protein TERMP_00224 [Thermococcus barophilus MP]
MFSIMAGGFYALAILIENPKDKKEADEDFKRCLIILLGIIGGSMLLYSDPEALMKVMEDSAWVVKLASVASLIATVATVISYHRLKRFEQEEMLEKLAEKMGEKLGESRVKGLKAKET